MLLRIDDIVSGIQKKAKTQQGGPMQPTEEEQAEGGGFGDGRDG